MSHYRVPENLLEPNLTNNTNNDNSWISSRIRQIKWRKDEGAQREERLRLVRRNWNNPGPQSKENNQQLYESMNEAAFWGGGAAVHTRCVMADVSWLMSTPQKSHRLCWRGQFWS